ncbi:response regulator [Polyangium sp. 6x1]|uniref:response regulator n=1 Tax=Polyangium sp. 6x1 TaxID=3042689 RepID=UPI0024823D48|nr:response regulator [Polyangium sp. 6x1]MDI1444403.1 response regulator [Polyangium sp. 6x1]
MPRVLIVDDEENQRKTLSIGLRLEGFEVVGAASGEEALRLLAEKPVDVAMVDLMLPGMSGLDLVRQIRRMFPNVRVYLASAYHLSARQMERADCGAAGFIPKPYALSELSGILQAKTPAPAQVAC